MIPGSPDRSTSFWTYLSVLDCATGYSTQVDELPTDFKLVNNF